MAKRNQFEGRCAECGATVAPASQPPAESAVHALRTLEKGLHAVQVQRSREQKALARVAMLVLQQQQYLLRAVAAPEAQRQFQVFFDALQEGKDMNN